MADLMTAIADMVQGIAAFMGINMTTGAAAEGDMEAWYFALGGMMEQVFGNVSTLMSGLGEVLNSLAMLFGGGHPV